MRRPLALLPLVVMLMALGACGKSASTSTPASDAASSQAAGPAGTASTQPASSPTEALATAKAHLDATSGVQFTLSTSDLPSGVTAPSSATGVLTRAPAFDGTITLLVLGINATVPVVAVDGKVWAKLPFTSSYQTIDPAKFGVPDPAALLDPTTGISSLLADSQNVTQGSNQRGGANNSSVLTEYNATLPGTSVARIIRKATGSFQVAYTIDNQGNLEGATLTGHFAGAASPSFTYTITLTDYGTTQQISAP